jgi:hypothetical protein
VDADELVRLAEEAHAAAPSDGTEATLLAAVKFRAHQALAAGNTAYAALAKRTHRSLGASLLTYALATGGPLAEAAAANPDVRRAAELVRDADRRYPDDASPWAWAVLRAVFPADAGPVGERAKANERNRVRTRIDRRLSPYSAGPVMDEYFLLLLDGREADAKKALADLAAKGVPLP